MILAGRLNGHFFDDLLVDRGVHWDFFNDGFRDGNLGGSKAIRVGTIGIGVSSIGSIGESISQGDGSSGGLISRPLPSGLSGDEAWDGVSETVFATGLDEFRLEALYFNFDFIGDIFVLNWGRNGVSIGVGTIPIPRVTKTISQRQSRQDSSRF